MLKLGVAVEWDGASLQLPMERIQFAEELGFDSVWCAEAYGSDAFSPLAYIAARTQRIKLSTSIAQVAARSAAACAMQANTIDALSGGRMQLGLGMSGPQIVEGWYGQPWGKPYWTLRDYVSIIRKVLAREEPVTHQGRALQLPTQAPGNIGFGKPLKSILHTRSDLPIYLGTGSQSMVTLTAEIADGWIPFGFVPGSMPIYRDWLEEGFRRAGGKRREQFYIHCGVQVMLTDRLDEAMHSLKSFTAFYVGGMGHPKMNFHKEMMIRRGYAEAAERIQELFLAGHREEAIAAVPDEYVDDGALLGAPARLRERFSRWRDAGADGLTLYGACPEAMRLLADCNRSLAG